MRLACGFGDAEIYQTQKQEDLTEASKQGPLSPGPLGAAVPEMLETKLRKSKHSSGQRTGALSQEPTNHLHMLRYPFHSL